MASTTITDIGLVLSNITTLTTVSSIIQTEAASAISSLSSITSAMNITGNTQTGTVGLIMTDVQLDEMGIIFADAILLALGSSLTVDTIVTVTSIINGVVSYEITTNVEDVSAAVTAIEAFMSNISTWDDITTYVEATVSSSIFDTITSGEPLSITSNTAGTTSLIENTLANVVLNTLTMEIISISGNTLVVKDLLNTGFTTVQDSSGTTVIISHVNTPLIDLIPSDVIGLANEIEYCLSVPLEPTQLIRPTTGGDNNNTDQSGMFVRPGVKGTRSVLTRELQQEEDLSSYEEIVCLSLPLDSLLSLSTTDVLPPSGLQV